MNFFAELLAKAVAKSTYVFFDADEWVKDKTGKGIVDRMTESREKDEALKENNPALWAAKKLAKGTAKGLIGISLHDD